MVIFQIYSSVSTILLGHWLDKGCCRSLEGLNKYFASLSGLSQRVDALLSLSPYNLALNRPYSLHPKCCVSSTFVATTIRHMTLCNSLFFSPFSRALMFHPISLSLCHFQKAFSRRPFVCLAVLRISAMCSFIADDRDHFQTLKCSVPRWVAPFLDACQFSS
jgi:hypothetical protein